MNAELILKWMIENTNQNAERIYNVDVWQRDLEDMLSGINSGRMVTLPSSIISRDNKDEDNVISILNKTFKNNITNISLVLNYLYPKKYLFYRVSVLEKEIFAGFKFLSETYKKLYFSFAKIGKSKDSFANYLILNEALLAFASDAWPNSKDPKSIQKKINYFLFEELAFLFLEKNSYNRYWMLVSGPESFHSLLYFPSFSLQPPTL